MYLDDYNTSATVDFKFTTRNTSGVPTTLGGSPVVKVYKGNSTSTETTTGVTLTADFDGVTGLNHVRIDLSADTSFYAAGNDFVVVITTGTVGGTSVVGEVVAVFSVLNRSPLRPTTSGRTLDVSTGGEAGVDWANVGSPTTTLNLSGTTVKTATDVETDTQDIQGRLPSALGANGNIKADLRDVNGTTIAGTATRVADAFVTFFNVASPVLTTASVNQTGDSFARIGGTGSALTSLAPASTALSTAQWTNARAAYLDNINNSTLAGATFPAEVASRTNITGGTITTVTNLTNAPTAGDLTAAMKASVNAEVDTALADIHLDHLIGSADPGGVVANSSFLAKLVSKSATPAFSSYDNTTDSLEALRDRGDAAWTTAVGFSTHSAADVWAVATRELTSGGVDAVQLESGINLRQGIAIILAANAGVVGVSGTTFTIRAADAPTTTRIVATADSSGSRTSITLTLPA